MNKVKFISGLANCHIPGLYSFVLSERESRYIGMRRIFYCGYDCNMKLWDGADFRIKPHNHRQTVTLKPIFGEVQNVEMLFGAHVNDPFHVWKYRFGSALLKGKFELERLEELQANVQLRNLEETIKLHWSNVHTVIAQPHSAWLVEEGELAPVGNERCFSISHRLWLPSEGLYQEMSADRLTTEEEIWTSLCDAHPTLNRLFL